MFKCKNLLHFAEYPSFLFPVVGVQELRQTLNRQPRLRASAAMLLYWVGFILLHPVWQCSRVTHLSQSKLERGQARPVNPAEIQRQPRLRVCALK